MILAHFARTWTPSLSLTIKKSKGNRCFQLQPFKMLRKINDFRPAGWPAGRMGQGHPYNMGKLLINRLSGVLCYCPLLGLIGP